MTAIKKSFKNGLILLTVLLAAPFFYLAIELKKILAKSSDHKKILIIDNAKIGDLICATPVFRSIKENFPDSQLALLVIPRVKEILQHNPRIDQLMTYSFNKKNSLLDAWRLIKKVRKEKFSVCLNLNSGTFNFILPFVAAIPQRITTISEENGFFYNRLALLCNHRLILRKEVLSVRHYLDLLKFIGITENNLKKEIFIDKISEKKAEIFLVSQGIVGENVVVGFCLSAGKKFKEWGLTNFAQLAKAIIGRYGYKIIAVGELKDRPMLLEKFRQLVGPAAIITCEDFSLAEVPALFKRFDYFISVDTGPLYIANALDVPVVDILGPCSLLAQPPIYEKCEAIHVDNLSCWPCSNGLDSVSGCAPGHLRCVKEISPELVLASFEKLIKRYPKTVII